MSRRLIVFALATGLAIGTVGCGGAAPTASTPAPVQNSPQTQAHNVNKLLADSLNALVKDAIASRKAGKLSPAATKQIEDWAGPATVISDKIETEIISTDAWPVQKQKITILLTGFQVPTIGGNIDPIVAAALASANALLLQLQAQVIQ